MNGQQFEYFAFISYNHQDRQYAVKLQKQLQRYRLPSVFVREHPDHPKRISPVFLDQTDLLAHEGALALSLQARLEASNYLIVLCSPHSAASPWVNAEVEYFLSHGRKDRIIPVILEGTPHAKDPEQECYPPALASLPAEDELLGISVADFGWRGAFLRVLATILHLKMDTVIKRDAAYRRRKRILAAGLVLAVAAGVFALVWHNTPHTSYFRSIRYRWAAPEGISPVSTSEKASLAAAWKLTSLRGRVVQAEYVNSADQLADDPTSLSTEPPMIRIVYDSDGNVSRKECFDLYRRPLYTLQYSGSLRIADFVSYESGNAVSLSSDSGSVLMPEDSLKEHTDIIRYVCSYDPDTGLETGRVYKRDNRGSDGGTSVADASGVWGQRFEYDEKERLIRSWNLGRDGEIITASGGCAGTEYAYDELDRIITVTSLSPDGQPMYTDSGSMTRIHWNDAGQPDELQYYGSTDDDSLHFILRNEYDSRGFRIGMQAFTGNGAVYFVVKGANSIRFERDDLGRTTRRTYCGPQGEPVNTPDGYASKTFQYNDAGQTIEEHTYAPDGSPALSIPDGAYGLRLYYDENGLMVRQECLDASGGIMSVPDGYAILEQSYNRDRQVEMIRILDEDGRPTLCSDGYAAMQNMYEDGHIVSVRCLDTHGDAFSLYSGYAWVERSFTNGLLTECALFGPDGKPVTGAEGWYRHCFRYNEYSQVSEEWYEGTGGVPVDTALGYARCRKDYDSQGRLVSEKYLKADGSEAVLPDLYYASGRVLEYGIFGVTAEEYQTDAPRDPSLPSRHEKVYDSQGLVVSESWMNTDGTPVADFNGNVRIDYGTNAARQLTKITVLRGDGSVWTSETVYDDFGRICGKVTGSEEIVLSEHYDFDEFSRTSSKSTEGYRLSDPDQVECEREDYTYDLYGRVTDVRHYDGRSGQPVLYNSTCFRLHSVYDSYGRLVAEENYDTDDQPCDVCGWFRTEYTYDRFSNLSGTVRYMADGSEAVKPLSLILITDITPGSWADSEGIPVYSYLLRFGAWTIDRIAEAPDTWYDELDDEISNGTREDPAFPLITLEQDENGRYYFARRTPPAGFMGITWTPFDVDEELYNQVVEFRRGYEEQSASDSSE